MVSNPIVFIAFKGSDNHGIGYLRAVLTEAGFKTRVLDLRAGKNVILKKLKGYNPKIVGFSIIFQSHINQFIDLGLFVIVRSKEERIT